MCGISGIASVKPISERKWLADGLDLMAHRGPDDVGEWWSADGRVGLGHRRLSIIDLSEAGHQPMHHPDKYLTIIFNGEIYNFLELREQLSTKGHIFRSLSDTEVIMCAYFEWGTDCVDHLVGMFAIAIFDGKNGTLFCARDRAGEKPFFYSLKSGTLRFASEIKGMLPDPNVSRKIDLTALDCYLSFGYAPGDLCILKEMNKLPPAHAMLYNLENADLKVWRYWSLPTKNNLTSSSKEEDLLSELEALLEDSVKKQMIADVPVGVLLSGGVDSSLVTAMAVRASKNVKTFTVSFPEYSRYDESEHAKLISDYFQTEHLVLPVSNVSIDILPRLAKQYDEPLVDSSMIPTYLVSELVREHCTVALGGDGGDELFGGYGHHSNLLWMHEKTSKIPLIARKVVSEAANFLPLGFKGRVWLQNLAEDTKIGLPLIASLFDSRTRAKILAHQKSLPSVSEGLRKNQIPVTNNLLERVTRMDFMNYLPEDILVKVDRASMLNSLEMRAPLLDHRLIEFAFGKVPTELKATSTERKIILKKLAAKILPPEFDKKRKQGFGVPIGEWLKEGDWHEYAKDILLDQSSLFDHRIVKNLLIGQTQGRNNTERLFGLLMFELWRREYNITY